MDLLQWMSKHKDIEVMLSKEVNGVGIRMTHRTGRQTCKVIVSDTEMASARYGVDAILDTMLYELSRYSMRI